MFRAHRLTNLNFILRGLALAVLLRSLIAPGFMLGVAADGVLNIVLCNGPAGIYAQSQGHDGRSRHQGHGDGQDADGATQITPACTHWSTSGHYVFAAFDMPLLTDAGPDLGRPLPAITVIQLYPSSARSTRGPPALI